MGGRDHLGDGGALRGDHRDRFRWALQQALALQGFDRFGIPGGQLAIYVVLSALLGVVAAIPPARRASKLDILGSIAYE